MAKVPFYFDQKRICIGDFYIARNTGLVAFVYLLKAVDLSCEQPEEGTVCVDNATLFHNLHGKCFFRFTESKGGGQVFSRVKFVIDPDLYPGLKNMSRTKRMESLRDFVSVSLNDRLDALSKGETDGFSKTGENLYESPLVRIKLELDRYHVVITASYRERAENDTPAASAAVSELLGRVEDLESRMERVEKENRELRKVNDMILGMFGGMKSAHDVAGISIPDDNAGISNGKGGGTADPADIKRINLTDTGSLPSPEKISALLSRYN